MDFASCCSPPHSCLWVKPQQSPYGRHSPNGSFGTVFHLLPSPSPCSPASSYSRRGTVSALSLLIHTPDVTSSHLPLHLTCPPQVTSFEIFFFILQIPAQKPHLSRAPWWDLSLFSSNAPLHDCLQPLIMKNPSSKLTGLCL